MARFVKIGKLNEMINVEQITHIYANEKLKNYTVCMVNGRLTMNYLKSQGNGSTSQVIRNTK